MKPMSSAALPCFTRREVTEGDCDTLVIPCGLAASFTLNPGKGTKARLEIKF